MINEVEGLTERKLILKLPHCGAFANEPIKYTANYRLPWLACHLPYVTVYPDLYILTLT